MEFINSHMTLLYSERMSLFTCAPSQCSSCQRDDQFNCELYLTQCALDAMQEKKFCSIETKDSRVFICCNSLVQMMFQLNRNSLWRTPRLTCTARNYFFVVSLCAVHRRKKFWKIIFPAPVCMLHIFSRIHFNNWIFTVSEIHYKMCFWLSRIIYCMRLRRGSKNERKNESSKKEKFSALSSCEKVVVVRQASKPSKKDMKTFSFVPLLLIIFVAIYKYKLLNKHKHSLPHTHPFLSRARRLLREWLFNIHAKKRERSLWGF